MNLQQRYNNDDSINAKGELQERIADLNSTIKPQKIKYDTFTMQSGKWKCYLNVVDAGNYESNPRNKKLEAEQSAAYKALNDWYNIKSKLMSTTTTTTTDYKRNRDYKYRVKLQTKEQKYVHFNDGGGGGGGDNGQELISSSLFEQAGRLFLQAIRLSLEAENIEEKSRQTKTPPSSGSRSSFRSRSSESSLY